MPIFSFSGNVVLPITIAEVPVRIGLVKKIVEFIIINIDSPYNAILGCGWSRQMRSVAFPYHQKIKFPSNHGIVEISGK